MTCGSAGGSTAAGAVSGPVGGAVVSLAEAEMRAGVERVRNSTMARKGINPGETFRRSIMPPTLRSICKG
jgi:hypothetical protein